MIIKKIIHQIQYFGTQTTIKLYNNDNIFENVTLQLKPIYIYINVSKLEIQKNNIDWFVDQFTDYNDDFMSTIPENNKVIIVLDHMSRDIVDGFGSTFETSKAKLFFTYLATHSYNTGLKYVVLVVTNYTSYAEDILNLNGGKKIHAVISNKIVL